MNKLPAVETAKNLFEVAKVWGAWRWLAEKRRARAAADAAWDALEEHEKKVRARWSDAMQRAYDEDRELHSAVRKAHKARMDAEYQFEEADRLMSSELARQGAHMAIDAWEMRETLIRRLEKFSAAK
jgi:hypothetical protein